MIQRISKGSLILLITAMMALNASICMGFSTNSAFVSGYKSSSQLKAVQFPVETAMESSSQNVGAVDLAGFLSENLVDFISSPAILLIPIGFAVSIAAVVAWFLVSSANPTVIKNVDKD